MSEFVEFGKIPRLNRPCVISEKIDGTNAQVHVLDDGTVLAGSRTRYLTLESDNFGFAAWVKENESELRGLGPGRHYGEWWGKGIQRGYGLDHRRFSLFNTSRWNEGNKPACCHVVPVLGAIEGPAPSTTFHYCNLLKEHGSQAAPGFMNPEGVVVFHTHSGHLYKVTFDSDGHKGQART